MGYLKKQRKIFAFFQIKIINTKLFFLLSVKFRKHIIWEQVLHILNRNLQNAENIPQYINT